MLYGVDPKSLIAGRASLERRRITLQRELIKQGVQRFTPITVNLAGVVHDGNHAVRAAIEDNRAVDVLIVDFPTTSFGPIEQLPLEG
jgi:hypothetical protein